MVIMGSGFEPGTELYVVMDSTNGPPSNIADFMDPAPVVDETGSFIGLFLFGRYERVSAEGVYSIAVTDTSYNTLAVTPLGIADPDGRSRLGIYPRKAPDYEKNPDDIRPAEWCAPFFEYPERPE
jgi:hypothetical protein